MTKKSDCASWGALVLRVVLAAIFLFHGIPKAFDWGMASEKFVKMGFPGMLGGPVGVIEVVGAVFILLGFYHIWALYVLATIIVVSIVSVQIPGAMEAGKLLTASLERDLLIFAGTLFLAWSGPGKFVLRKD